MSSTGKRRRFIIPDQVRPITPRPDSASKPASADLLHHVD
jgi:hypothetical protein